MKSLLLSAMILPMYFLGQEPPSKLPPLPIPVKAPVERFLGTFSIGEVSFAVMSSTEAVLDGKPTPYAKIPDEGTELVEVAIDLERRVMKRMVYVTKKEF